MKNLLAILTVLLAHIVYSQNVSFQAIGPNVISNSDRFYLKYTINANASDFSAPNLSDFDILSGPNQSQSQSISFVNGKTSQEINITLTYILAPKKVGKFTIAPAKINVNGKTYQSNSVTIEVVQGTANNNQQNNQQNAQNQSNNTSTDEGNNIYVSVIPNKTTLYKGEQLTATVKIFTKYDIAGFEDVQFPSWNGFFKQEIPTPDQVTLNKENINGQIYYTAVLQKVVLQPQKNGKLVIEPAKFDIVIVKQVQRTNRRSIFDDFFNSGMQRFKVSVKSKPVTINVKELPTPPKDFDGAVGSFNFAASIDKNNVKENDAISLKVKIWGNGNLKLINEPKLIFPPDFELFDDAKISDNIKNTTEGTNGSRIYEYVFSPRHAGDYKIPPFNFVYFDPNLKKYKTFSSNEFNIHVEKGNDDSHEVTGIISGTTKQDIQYIGKDIRFIKTGNINLKEKNKFLFGSNFFVSIYLLSLLIFAILFIIRRKHIKDSSDIALMKNKKANKVAKKHLKNASISLKNNEKNKFYDDIAKALWGYIADKLSISGANLNKDNIEATLLNYNANSTIMKEFLELLEVCEYERYSPDSKEDRLAEVYANAETLIGKFERILKRIKN